MLAEMLEAEPMLIEILVESILQLKLVAVLMGLIMKETALQPPLLRRHECRCLRHRLDESPCLHLLQ